MIFTTRDEYVLLPFFLTFKKKKRGPNLTFERAPKPAWAMHYRVTRNILHLAISPMCCRISCTIALEYPKKVGTSWKEAWPNTLVTDQLHHLKHDSGIFASVMPDPASMHCNLLSVFVLAL